jgi:hypothetical protein
MSMIAFYYVNGREPILASEYELVDSTDEDSTDEDPIEDDPIEDDPIEDDPIEDDRSDIILPTQKEIISELPKYIAHSTKKAPKHLNYGLVLATLFKDVYEIAAEKEAITQKDCRRNMKFLKHLTTMECVY